MLNGLPSILGTGTTTLAGNFYSISTTTLGVGGATNVSFSSIPSTYTHLQLRITALGTTATTYSNFYMQLNGDTAANYAYHGLGGNGTSAFASGGSSLTTIQSIGEAGTTTSTAGVTIIDILDYKNTNKYKTVRGLTGDDANGAGQVLFGSGLWQSTSAISSILLQPALGTFAQYSSFALYGVL
jgi:hypothetical protein